MEWVRAKVISPVQGVLSSGLTPEKLSLSVACGFVGGVFPIPGTTTVVCLPLIAATGANPVLAQVINLVMTPVELALIPWFAALGASVIPGSQAVELSAASLTAALQQDVWAALATFQTALLYAIVGWFVFLPGAMVLIVLALRPVFAGLERRRQRRAHSD